MESRTSLTAPEIKAAVKAYVLEKFLPGEDPDMLTDDTPLITSGVLDSISTIELGGYLDEEFGARLAAHEMNADYLDTLNIIADTVQRKTAA